MTTSWQNSFTWKEGLVREMPVKRLQTVNGNDGIEVILCEKVNKGLPVSLENIGKKQTIRTGEMGTAPFTFSADQYVCLVIDTRRRTVRIECNFTTQESIKGSLTLHVDYRVIDTHKVVFQSEDALGQLILLCKKKIISIGLKNKYTQLDPAVFESAILGVNADYLGLEIEDVNITDPINWPSDITDIQGRIPILEIEATMRARERSLLREKLIEMGIPDSAIKVVMASKDEDLNVIFSAAEKYSQNKREIREETKQFLIWLSDNEYLPRTLLEEKFIPRLLGKVEDDLLFEPDPVNLLLSSSSDMKSASEVKEHNPSGDNQNDSSPSDTTKTHSVDRVEGEVITEKESKSHSVTRRPAKPR